MEADFNFMASETQSDLDAMQTPNIGPNKLSKMTPKKFAQAVLEVFDTLGGASWLLTEAQADPKAFMGLLTKLIPKSVQLDGLAGFSVNLIDQFGASISIQSTDPSTDLSAAPPINPQIIDEPLPRTGHPATGVNDNRRIATSGNPTSQYDVIDIFKEEEHSGK